MMDWRNNLQISACQTYTSDISVPPYPFPYGFPTRSSSPSTVLMLSWLTLTMPNPILLLLYSSSCSHHVLRSRHGTPQRSSATNRMRYCEDTRPGQQLEAAQQQHADLCNFLLRLSCPCRQSKFRGLSTFLPGLVTGLVVSAQLPSLADIVM
eukprot:25029-Pelagomonas_calceolata.AAC.1